MSVRRPKFVLGAISILLTGAIASCSAPVDSVLNGLGEGNGDRVSVAGDAQEGIEGDSDKYGPIGSTKVAPGTLPPTGEPQPGHARLNSEGYYDYTADDFVLGDPCPPESLEIFINEGFEVDRHQKDEKDDPRDPRFCIVDINSKGPGTGISIEPKSAKDHQADGGEIEFISDQGTTAYFVPLGSGTTGVCKAGIDTPDGSRGIYQPWGEKSDYRTPSDACEIAVSRLFHYKIGAR